MWRIPQALGVVHIYIHTYILSTVIGLDTGPLLVRTRQTRDNNLDFSVMMAHFQPVDGNIENEEAVNLLMCSDYSISCSYQSVISNRISKSRNPRSKTP